MKILQLTKTMKNPFDTSEFDSLKDSKITNMDKFKPHYKINRNSKFTEVIIFQKDGMDVVHYDNK